jgi:hypothetical protein
MKSELPSAARGAVDSRGAGSARRQGTRLHEAVERGGSRSNSASSLGPAVAHDADIACERGANVSRSTRVHVRVTPPRPIPVVCGVFVTAMTRAYPRVPAVAQDGKEGSAVRVRQRASQKALEIAWSSCLASKRAGRAGTCGPRWCSHDVSTVNWHPA